MFRTVHVLTALTVLCLLFLALLSPAPVSADPHPGQSVNVAYIDSLSVINGGTFPTATSSYAGSFTEYSFFRLPIANVGAAALGPGGVCGSSGCDTVLLNVASSGMYCNINRLTAQQKADLVNFVAGGYKLIIYDSECAPQDYSWLPFPFTTANPGAQGAQGTLSIVEENTLSSNDPNNVHFIDAQMLSTGTDAVGDMNVMTTVDPNWFVDMSGTNILNVTGPVHTYAKYPSGGDQGLVIYNGLDVDYMSSSTIPDPITPAGNLAKIWLHELQQPYNPSGLPGGNPVVGIALSPLDATLEVGQLHTVTARLTDLLGVPQPGILVSFNVVSGPNAGVIGLCSPDASCVTDANGQVGFSYTGMGGEGTDQIDACFVSQTGQTICAQTATVEWTPPVMQPVIDYWALGDSIASGHGLMDDGTECRRSEKAYPYMVKQLLESRYEQVNFYFFACSGARAGYDAEEVVKDRYKWLHTQVDDALTNLSDRPTLVSINIGANDFRWSDPLNFYRRLSQPPVAYYNWVTQTKESVGSELRQEVARLLAYPNVAVVLTTVYNPANQESKFFSLLPGRNCDVLFGFLTCYEKMDTGVELLNTAYVLDVFVPLGRPDRLRVAANMNVRFVGHEAPSPSCGGVAIASDTWVQYPGDPNSNAELPQILRRLWSISDTEKGDCFHPNEQGAWAYARAVDEAAQQVGR